MKTFFKPLAIAATLIATLTPAKAYLGVVDFTLPEPIGCRNLDDAIEASKFNGFEAEQRVYLPKVEFVKRHQTRACTHKSPTSGAKANIP
jgi:hypothetical protein